MSRFRLTRVRSQAGQAIVLIALTGTLMIAGIGLAVDVVVGYLYQVSSERAAAAAALSGVVFMPDQFTGASAVPTGSRNDATDRAVDEAKRNGFDPANTGDGVVVTPSRVPGHTNQLQVTVGRQAPVFFMVMFGFKPYQVSATAIAAYLPPISLGQPGSQAGSSRLLRWWKIIPASRMESTARSSSSTCIGKLRNLVRAFLTPK